MRAKKRARAARAMVTRVGVGDEESNGDVGNMARNNDDSLVPVFVQQPVLYSSSASLDDAGDDKSILLVWSVSIVEATNG